MNWLNIRTNARNRLQDASAKIWSNTELLSYANETLDDLTIGSEANINRTTIPMVQSQRTYSLPASLFELRGVRINGKKMFGTQAFRLEDLDSQYLTGTGNPEWYYLEDAETIAVYPIPSWTTSTTTFTQETGELVQWNDGTSNYSANQEIGCVIDMVSSDPNTTYQLDSLYGVVIEADANAYVMEVEYVERIANLSNDTDTPDLPNYMHYAVMYGVLYKSFEREGQGQNLILTKRYAERYKELQTEWYARNREFSHGQDQFPSQQNTTWGSDLDWRFRVWP